MSFTLQTCLDLAAWIHTDCMQLDAMKQAVAVMAWMLFQASNLAAMMPRVAKPN